MQPAAHCTELASGEDVKMNDMEIRLWFLLTWLFVLGAIIGSFLNVVIYRLPRGLSLQRPGSQCPRCGHPIRWYDNVPIFGWLWLRGRCRDCRAAISPRYPLVELAVGLMFLTLGWTDWARPQQLAWEAADTAAIQAARQKSNRAADAQDSSPSEATASKATEAGGQTAQFVWQYVFHLLLLCPLLAALLIDVDGNNLPRRLITWPAAGGILIAMFWPQVQAFPLWHASASEEWISIRALATAFVGMLTAVVMRLAILNQMGLQRPRELGLWNSTLALYAVGAFLGWQAVLVIGGAANIWSLIKPAAPAKRVMARIQPTAIVFFGSLLWCLVEQPLAAWIHSW